MPISKFKTTDNPLSKIISIDKCCDSEYMTISNVICDIATVMPFRVRFQTIDDAGYSPFEPAPIGIAIIGFNNYIL